MTVGVCRDYNAAGMEIGAFVLTMGSGSQSREDFATLDDAHRRAGEKVDSATANGWRIVSLDLTEEREPQGDCVCFPDGTWGGSNGPQPECDQHGLPSAAYQAGKAAMLAEVRDHLKRLRTATTDPFVALEAAGTLAMVDEYAKRQGL
jgi:hypothetical protein